MIRRRRATTEKLVPVTPTYQLSLHADEPAEIDTTDSAIVKEGTELRVVCHADESFQDVQLDIAGRSGGTMKVEGNTVTLTIKKNDNFSGLYECSAKNKLSDDVTHSRKLRLLTIAQVPDHLTPCEKNSTYCFGNAACAIQNNRELCVCPKDYIGERCENHLVSDVVSMSTVHVLNNAKIAFGANSTVCLIFVGLTILFGLLFLHERKRMKRMMKHFGPLPQARYPLYDSDEPDASPYPYIDYASNTKSSYSTNDSKLDGVTVYSTNNAPPPPSSSGGSFNKFRQAFRQVRLPGTSDSKLLEPSGTGS